MSNIRVQLPVDETSGALTTGFRNRFVTGGVTLQCLGRVRRGRLGTDGRLLQHLQ